MSRLIMALLCISAPAAVSCAQSARTAPIKDPVVARVDAARPDYADATTRRLEVLTQIWGNLGLFHPLPSAERLRWDDVLVEALGALRGVRSDREFADMLNRVVFKPLRDPLAYATTIAAERETISLPAALTRQWLSAGTAYVSAANRVYAGPYHAPDFAHRLRAVIDTLERERRLERLVVDLRSSSGGYYREGVAGLWLGMWLREATRMGTPLSVLRESGGFELSEVKWIVSPRDSLPALGPPIPVPTVFLVNRTSYAAAERAIDAVRATRSDVAVILEEAGPIPNLGYNGWRTWYPDSLLLPHGRIPIISVDGALGTVVDLTAPALTGLDRLDAAAARALTERAGRTPRPTFAFADARITDDTVSIGPLSREQRVAGLLKLWFWVGHFFAYLEDASIEWRHLVSTWLARVEEANDARTYYRVVEQIGALLNDSHTSVLHPLATFAIYRPLGVYQSYYTPPLYLTWVGARLAIARVDTSDTRLPLTPGDEVLEIDGVRVHDLERTHRQHSSISTTGSRIPIPGLMRSLEKDSPVSLRIRTATGTRTVTLLRSRRVFDVYGQVFHEHPPFAVLPGNIGYLNLGRVNSGPMYDSAMTALAGTAGLVIDDRSVFSQGTDLAPYLSETTPWIPTVTSVAYQHGSYTPMRLFGTSQTWDVPSLSTVPRYSKPLVVITSSLKISGGESLAIWLRNHKRAAFVGEPTNGTYGSNQGITIPGGARITFTGVRALDAGGGKYHGVGVTPDIAVTPTFAGLRARRDEVYEKAVATLRSLVIQREHAR
jgi:C-terminal processing protease CtpA/Prc